MMKRKYVEETEHKPNFTRRWGKCTSNSVVGEGMVRLFARISACLHTCKCSSFIHDRM